ncbi:MAG: sigma-54 dependent transcriptional regulator [Bacteroidota bacterium]
MKKVLCVDDDTDICLLLSRFLGKNGYAVDTAFNGTTALEKLKNEPYDLVICDFRLPDKDGLEMIKAIKSTRPDTQIIIITGYSDVKIAVKAMKYGAFEYVTKPIHPEEILITIKDALAASENKAEAPSASATVSSETKPARRSSANAEAGGLVYVKGESQRSKHIQKLIELVAPTDMTVIILGESGTGKEVAAKAIHFMSKRKNNAFVAVDCGALPAELAASELFGHKKGAFTGAMFDKIGQFELANGGTLFLDEIGNLSYENQVKLLRVLQERKVRRIGDTKDIDVDIRIIVATNEDLKKAVKEGTFREDIYYRINEFVIELPALRERKDDVILYANHFLDMANSELDKDVKGFSENAMNKFKSYPWPGNLREMKNVIKRATLFAENTNIDGQHLPSEIMNPDLSIMMMEESVEDDDIIDLKTATDRAEKKIILKALAQTGFRKSKTAELLKIDRKTLYNKLVQLGIDT